MSLVNPPMVTSSPVIENERASFDVQSGQCPRFVEFLGTHGSFNFKLELKEMCDRSAKALVVDFYQFVKEDALSTIETLIKHAVPMSYVIQALEMVTAIAAANELKALVDTVRKEAKPVIDKIEREVDRIVDQIQQETPKVLDKAEKETDRVLKQTEKALKKGKKKLKKFKF